ncbi:MAG: hypothetical protein AB7O24_05850 [Kofleriaceae bacterium]
MRFVALLLLVASCGDGRWVPDASIPSDDNRGLVSLTIRSDQPIASTDIVYFQNADFSLVLATRPRPDGVANAFMAPGGYVTYVGANASSRLIYTFSAVQPGDELVLDTRFDGAFGPPLSFRMLAELDPAGFFYELRTTCGSFDLGINPSPTETFALDQNLVLPSCAGEKADMLLLGRSEQQRPNRFQFVRDITDAVRFAADDYSVPTPITVEVNGLPAPASVPRVGLARQVVLNGTALFDQLVTVFPQTDTAAATFDVPEIPEATSITRVEITRTLDVIGTQNIVEWSQYSAPISLDYRQLELREYTSLPIFEVTRDTLSWTESTKGELADAVFAGIEFFRPEAQTWWTLIAPRSAESSVRFPALPDTTLNPNGDDFVTVYLLANLSVTGGYDAVRPTLLGDWGLGQPMPTFGPSGRMVYQTVNPSLVPEF